MTYNPNEYLERLQRLEDNNKELKELLIREGTYEKSIEATGRLWGGKIRELRLAGDVGAWRIVPITHIEKAFNDHFTDSKGNLSADIFDAIIRHVKI